MTDHITALEAALQAGPTDGPWFTHDTLGHAVCAVGRTRVCTDSPPAAKSIASDAAFIAAANPAAIRAVLAELRRLRAENEALMAEIASLVAQVDRLTALDRPRVDKMNQLVIQGARADEKIAALEAENETLKLVAVRGIHHYGSCSYIEDGATCDCGLLQEAIKAAQAAKEK